MKKKYTPSLHWAILEKNKIGGLKIWNFQKGIYQRNSMWIGISGGDQEKIMWNFQGSWFLVLELLRDVIQFCTIARGGAFICLEFLGVK